MLLFIELKGKLSTKAETRDLAGACSVCVKVEGEGGREEEGGGEMSLFSMWEKLKSDECFDKCVITLNYR